LEHALTHCETDGGADVTDRRAAHMTDAFTYHVPITAEMYARIKDGLGPQVPRA
jgi:hypothetical protein